MKTMTLQHIDNCFFKLSERQAKALCIDGKLPRSGMEKKAKLPEDLQLIDSKGQPFRLNPHEASQVWVKPTALTWWKGKPLKRGWTWAISFYWSL